jgi:hypothetical protein
MRDGVPPSGLTPQDVVDTDDDVSIKQSELRIRYQ